MQYEIIGGAFPVVECTLSAGQKMVTQGGGMAWMDPSITMETKGGGIGKVLGRMLSNESMFQNIYTSTRDGSKIAFGTGVPGSIMAIRVEPGHSVICQKSAFLASYGNVELSMHFNKKVGAGFFGGEGFIMQKVSGDGIVFIEIDGASKEFQLAQGQQLILNTGFLVTMEETCTMDIQAVSGVKNMLLGGEGIFNTVVTGPGRIIVQTMPIADFAKAIIPYIPRGNNN